MDNFDHKCVFSLVIMVADHYYYQHQTISSASSLPRISVWDMILCIPDNYFYSPRLSDSLREITPGWLLDTAQVHIGWEMGPISVIPRPEILVLTQWHIIVTNNLNLSQ